MIHAIYTYLIIGAFFAGGNRGTVKQSLGLFVGWPVLIYKIIMECRRSKRKARR